MKQIPIYLASRSPRRRMLLKKMKVTFQSMNPNISEDIKEQNPKRLAIKLAEQKVMSIEQKIRKGIIIGVDTIVVINDRILGKPGNRQEARKILNLLNGKTHKVISGIFVLKKPEYQFFKGSECTRVKFRKISKNEMKKYIESKEPYDKAGAYGIQSKGGSFVKKIEGCYYNVVGLPITKLLIALREILLNK